MADVRLARASSVTARTVSLPHLRCAGRAAFTATLLTAVACVTPPGGIPPTADLDPGSAGIGTLLGSWSIQAADGQSPSLSVSFDSLTTAGVSGHVLRYMAGDTGLGPRDFLPFTCELPGDGSLSCPISLREGPESAGIRLRFDESSDDTTGQHGLDVREVWIAGEELSSGRPWVARRAARSSPGF